jgi:hypothetical protein
MHAMPSGVADGKTPENTQAAALRRRWSEMHQHFARMFAYPRFAATVITQIVANHIGALAALLGLFAVTTSSASAAPFLASEVRAWVRIDNIEVNGQSVFTSPLLALDLLQWSSSGVRLGVPPTHVSESSVFGQYVPAATPEFAFPQPRVGDAGGVRAQTLVEFLGPASYASTEVSSFAAALRLAPGGHTARLSATAWFESSLSASLTGSAGVNGQSFQRDAAVSVLSLSSSVSDALGSASRTEWSRTHALADADTASSFVSPPISFEVFALSGASQPAEVGIELALSRTLSGTLIPAPHAWGVVAAGGVLVARGSLRPRRRTSTNAAVSA